MDLFCWAVPLTCHRAISILDSDYLSLFSFRTHAFHFLSARIISIMFIKLVYVYKARWRPLALLGLCVLGLSLRLYNINWDQGNSFHPDERQILFHVVSVGWPTSFSQFLDPVNSPLNPHFFAYGSFPIYVLALLGHIFLHASEMSALPALTL